MNRPSRETQPADKAPHLQVITFAVRNARATPSGHLLATRVTKSDPEERKSRLGVLLAAHEVIFFHRITQTFRSLRANRPAMAGVGHA